MKKNSILPLEEKPQRHSYCLLQITALLSMKLGTSVSFRALAKIGLIWRQFSRNWLRTPCHNTILNWLLKVGYYALCSPKPVARDWVIILDTSIQLGQDKVLVVLGVRASDIDFNRPLKYGDLSTLVIAVNRHWTGDAVSRELVKLSDRLGAISYAVGDHGGEIKKGLELAGIRQVHDITHALALGVEKRFRNDVSYKDFHSEMSRMRARLSQSVAAHIIPPTQRKKSAYQNIRPVATWAIKALRFLDSPEAGLPEKKREKEELEWLNAHRDLVGELFQLSTAINRVEKVLKHKGLSADTLKSTNATLNQLDITGASAFKDRFIKELAGSLQLLPEHKNIVCTSDILESAFGKYKNYLSHNPMAGVTRLVLVIAAFCSPLDHNHLKICLENTTMKQVHHWVEINIGPTLFKKRNETIRFA